MLVDDDVFQPKGFGEGEQSSNQRGTARLECISKLFVLSCTASFGDHKKMIEIKVRREAKKTERQKQWCDDISSAKGHERKHAKR